MFRGFLAAVVVALLLLATLCLELTAFAADSSGIHLRAGVLQPSSHNSIDSASGSFEALWTTHLSLSSHQHPRFTQVEDLIRQVHSHPQRRSFLVRVHSASPTTVQRLRAVLASLEGVQPQQVEVAYVPQRTYLVFCTHSSVQTLQQEHQDLVQWVGLYQPSHKVGTSTAPLLATNTQISSVPGMLWALGRAMRHFQEPSPSSSVPQSSGVRLNVELATHGAELDSTAFAQELEASLGRIGHSVSVRASSQRGRILGIYVRNAVELPSVVRFLTALPRVLWVEKALPRRTKNYVARGITQTNDPARAPLEGLLTGKGQVVGVGDSGLDVNSCYFYDAQEPVFYTRLPAKSTSLHRKVKAYWEFMDREFEDGAHGTHVSGSVAGSALEPALQAYNGMARDSKLVFTDCSCKQAGGCTCPEGIPCDCDYYGNEKCPDDNAGIYLPLDLGLYFDFARENGARIHTNSWGDDSNDYTLSSKMIDDYIYNHRDFLVLFAAGNSGFSRSGTLGSQANCKNTVVVGASLVGHDAFVEGHDRFYDYEGISLYIGELLWQNYWCQFSDPSNLDDTCKVADFLRNGGDCCSSTGPCAAPNGTSVCGCYGLSTTNLGTICCHQCSVEAYSSADPFTASVENMAYFSSTGPTADMRCKPDITAPGSVIVSSRSYEDSAANRCGSGATADKSPEETLTLMQGTSMATPITAGNAALIREYLTSYYPNPAGVRENATVIENPSASLLKATIMAAGNPIYGQFCDGRTCDDDVDVSTISEMERRMIQGAGLLTLSRIIPAVQGEKDSGLLVLSNEDRPISQSEEHTYSFVLRDVAPMLSVSLVYTDLPPAQASSWTLVSDLELVVVKPDGQLIQTRDFLNNVALYQLRNATAGNYTVQVLGYNIPVREVPYSLVVAGHGGLHFHPTPEPPAPTDPVHKGIPGPAIAGLVALGLLVAGLLVSCGIYLVKRARRSRQTDASSSSYGQLQEERGGSSQEMSVVSSSRLTASAGASSSTATTS